MLSGALMICTVCSLQVDAVYRDNVENEFMVTDLFGWLELWC